MRGQHSAIFRRTIILVAGVCAAAFGKEPNAREGSGFGLRSSSSGAVSQGSARSGANINIPLLPGVVNGVDHDILKNRVISINPNLESVEARLRVELLDLACSFTGKKCNGDSDCKICDAGSDAGNGCSINSDCVGGACVTSGESCDEQSPPLMLGYVGEPFQPGGDAKPGTLGAPVVDEPPEFRFWPETLVHVVDCEIAPGQTYAISAESMEAPGLFAIPLVIGTTPTPQGKSWGDLVGSFDGTKWSGPDNLVGVNDIQAMLAFLTNKPGSSHVTAMDLVEVQLFEVSGTDLHHLLKAFQGALFPPPSLLDEGYPKLQAGASLADCTGN